MNKIQIGQRRPPSEVSRQQVKVRVKKNKWKNNKNKKVSRFISTLQQCAIIVSVNSPPTTNPDTGTYQKHYSSQLRKMKMIQISKTLLTNFGIPTSPATTPNNFCCPTPNVCE